MSRAPRQLRRLSGIAAWALLLLGALAGWSTACASAPGAPSARVAHAAAPAADEHGDHRHHSGAPSDGSGEGKGHTLPCLLTMACGLALAADETQLPAGTAGPDLAPSAPRAIAPRSFALAPEPPPPRG